MIRATPRATTPPPPTPASKARAGVSRLHPAIGSQGRGGAAEAPEGWEPPEDTP